MTAALDEARAASERDEVPVGAVVVRGDRIIGRGHNQRETLADPTAHAEMIAITAAAEFLRDWRLAGCAIYVTLEPCPMCAGAMVLSRLDRLVYGADDPKLGACGSMFSIVDDPRTNHQLEVVRGVLAGESTVLLQAFFHKQRGLGKK